ncbi:MAG: ABC transporter substrate-binding protein [Clostridiales bacterium]|nr:ABC transporter substrate-binding protein [Clostridiales bacterium]
MKKRQFALILALALGLSLLASCGTVLEKPEENTGSFQLVDMEGRVLNLEGPAERVIALTASDCEILFALGAGDFVIARGQYCNYPEKALELQAISSGSETNTEQIIALKPDLVIMNMMDQTLKQIAAMEKAGIPVVVNSAESIDEVYKSIELIGKAVGKDMEAETLVSDMRKNFEDISSKSIQGEKTVYFEVSPLEYGLWTAGKGTFMDEIVELLGMKNAFPDVSGWAEISQEQVIERNPDYIVTISMGTLGQPSPTEEIMSRRGWQGIKAVSEGAVTEIDSDEIARPGPRLVSAAEGLYAFFYGD